MTSLATRVPTACLLGVLLALVGGCLKAPAPKPGPRAPEDPAIVHARNLQFTPEQQVAKNFLDAAEAFVAGKYDASEKLAREADRALFPASHAGISWLIQDCLVARDKATPAEVTSRKSREWAYIVTVFKKPRNSKAEQALIEKIAGTLPEPFDPSRPPTPAQLAGWRAAIRATPPTP